MVEQNRDCEDKEVENAPQKYARKSYVKPQLTEYGHMEKLTQSGTGNVSDGVFTKLKY
jgi:hypothetical protein